MNEYNLLFEKYKNVKTYRRDGLDFIPRKWLLFNEELIM